jgi:soluble lytic murein transglycosylase-like protein
MRASLIILTLLVLFVTDTRAQEASFPLSVEGAAQLQRTPALVVHEVVATPAVAKPAAALKKQGYANAASKPSTAVTPSMAQPIIVPAHSDSVRGEIGTTGNPKYDALITQAAARHGVDPNLVIAVMRQESGFNSRALSYKGASGLMQLMPGTARRFGVTNIFDPAQNIEGGTRYLRFLLDTFNGDVKLVLAGYNAGENAVVNSGYRIPRYRETQNYVRSISARYDAGKNRAAGAPRAAKAVAPSVETFSNGRLSNNY